MQLAIAHNYHNNKKKLLYTKIYNNNYYKQHYFFLAVSPAPALNLKNIISPSSTT